MYNEHTGKNVINADWKLNVQHTKTNTFEAHVSYVYFRSTTSFLEDHTIHWAYLRSLVPIGQVVWWLRWPLWNICFTNDHGYVPLVVSTSLYFPLSWLITGFVTRLTRWVPLVEQELLTLPEHLTCSPVFSVVRVTRSLVLCICFVDRCL
jgi:hypothetical protein